MTNLDELFCLLARPTIREVEAYDAKLMENPAIRVSVNENNAGISQNVLSAMQNALVGGNRYGDSSNIALREKLAARFGLNADGIVTSCGLDGFFTMLSRAFLDPGDEVLISECTYSVYEDAVRIAAATPKKVPLGENNLQTPQNFADAVGPSTKMIFYCNPNNPTGTITDFATLRENLKKIPSRVIFVLDEAYIDFADCGDSASFALLDEFPNLIICRTFSKIYALAGLRVGWGVGHPALMNYLVRVREPYCVTDIAEAGACAAFDETDRIAALRAANAEERAKLCDALARCKVDFIPSQTNFVSLFPREKFDALAAAFVEKRISVRRQSLRGEPIMRISIGTPKENAEVIRVLESFFLGAR